MLIAKNPPESGGFKDGYVEVVLVKRVEAAHAATKAEDPCGQMECAVKAPPPNPGVRCGAYRPNWSAAGDGCGDRRRDVRADELVEMVAVEWGLPGQAATATR